VIEIPSHLPDWVGPEYREFVRDFGLSETVSEEEKAEGIEQVERVILNRGVVRLWRTLSDASIENIFRPREHGNRIQFLAGCIHVGFWGFGHESMPKTRRLHIASRAAKKLSEVKSLLEELSEPDHYSINSIVRDATDEFVEDRFRTELESFNLIWNADGHDFVSPEILRLAIPAISRVAKNFYGDAAFWNFGETADILSDGLKQWANRSRSIQKPGHPNARRLFFIRSLVRDFTENFGKLWRGETLELTSVFFDCADLDEAAITKLAPDPRRKRLNQSAKNPHIDSGESIDGDSGP